MSNTRKYFHDRFVLLILTINIFLAFLCIATVLFRLGSAGDDYTYIYHQNPDSRISDFKVGGLGQIISFTVFAGVVLVGQLFASLRLYERRRAAAWIIMALSTLLLVVCLIVSNALLELR